MQVAAPFAERLREVLEDYDRMEVCRAIGKSRRAMTGWLNGSCEPLAGTLRDLCIALDVNADWLLGLTDTRKPCPLAA